MYSLALLPAATKLKEEGGEGEGEDGGKERELLVSSSEDGTVRIWDPNPRCPSKKEEGRGESRLVATIPHPITTVWSVDTLPTSRDLVSGGEDGVVRVFTQQPRAQPERQRSELGGEGEGVGEGMGVGAVGEVTKKEREEYEKGCEEVARKMGRVG